MRDDGPWQPDLSVEAIRRRAELRRLWLVGKIGDPVPWCRYCGQRIPSEWPHEQEAIEHNPGCPVPEALATRQPDFDALLAEVDRLRGQSESR
jgi:hypothetical protein